MRSSLGPEVLDFYWVVGGLVLLYVGAEWPLIGAWELAITNTHRAVFRGLLIFLSAFWGRWCLLGDDES